MGKVNARVAIAQPAPPTVDLSPYATKQELTPFAKATDVANTYATKQELDANLANDEQIKAMAVRLGQKEVADFQSIKTDFEGLQTGLKEVNDDLSVVEQNFASLAAEGYMSAPK